jgi:hypothetical protein
VEEDRPRWVPLLDDELVARAESGMLVGSSGIFMMVLEKYLTLANCGTT